ncbi:ABC transporter ATP-binding protein [archaeon]|nr:ABC transporter ATP-binding protein [archaeon]|tara:strand:- start:6843 stop:7748 length:906 start_codon:yes stop_codon:yes gene_type:complete
MNSVIIKNLTKKYKNLLAVDNISFNIKKGEIFGLLGPNGAGKTTIINCITQLSTITNGTIKVNSYDTKENYLEARKELGLSPQELKFDHYFPIQDILIYQGGYFGIPIKESKARTYKLLKLFDLFEKRKKTPSQLSGGMLRRLSLAKSMMHNSNILILDEPTAALDVESRHLLWEYIKDLNKKGITIILTTHYIEEAENLCDTICIIQKGKIIKLEKKEKLIEDLSRNIIRVLLKDKTTLPEIIKKYNYEYKDNILQVHVNKINQTKILNTILKELDKKVINFTIEQDNLERIFRRLINEH